MKIDFVNKKTLADDAEEYSFLDSSGMVKL